MTLLDSIASRANAGWSTPRLRVRSNTVSRGEIAVALREAATIGYGWSASHGGGVANAYGYPAETECTAVLAVRDGSTIHLSVGIGRRPANKVTEASAMQVLTHCGSGPWWTLACGRTPRIAPTTIHRGDVMATFRYRRALDGTILLRAQDQDGQCDRIPPPPPGASALPPRAARRILRAHGHDAHLDRQRRIVIGRGDDEYHLDRQPAWAYRTTVAAIEWLLSAATTAEAAITRRRTERRLAGRNERLDQVLATTPVWVSADDSVGAGNCPLGTTEFRRRVELELGAQGEIGAVRADMILALRDDNYTRRACRAAALRAGL